MILECKKKSFLKTLYIVVAIFILLVSKQDINAASFQQDEGSQGLVSMEAENYHDNVSQGGYDWLLTTSPSGYSGTGAMQALPEDYTNMTTGYSANSPRMDYQVEFVTTGTHYVWVLAYGPKNSSNSLHMGLDGAEVSSSADINIPVTGGYVWTTGTASIDISTTGVHTINVWMRESGTVVDKIVLSTDSGFVPTGTGPEESPQGESGNQSPSVDAGTNQTITLPESSVVLDGTVTDDGLPDPPAEVTVNWSQVSGPATVVFDNSAVVDTTATFSEAGTYVLQLTADDSELSASDEVTIMVYEEGGEVVTTEVRVASGSDDAEENSSGYVGLSSSDLELIYDSSDQTVGIRFAGVGIPQGANIVNAYVQFQVDEARSDATFLTIEGEATDDAETFISSTGNISSRSRTQSNVSWSPAEWSSVGEAGPDQRTSDISSIIQEIVSRSGWSSGNSLAVIITGTGKRVAESYNGDTSGAPLLHVEYTTGPPGNQPPVVEAGSNQTITLPESSVVLDGTVTDDGLPDPPAEVTVNWSQVSGPGTVVFDNSAAVDTTATFSEAGTYVLQLTADDSELSASDEVTIMVYEEGGEVVTAEIPVTGGSDDAEENSSGYVGLSSSDLELIHDSSDQTVGIRFAGVGIPQGANIVNAYVQFQVDEARSDTTLLIIEGEATDDAETFISSTGNISSRSRTQSNVSWSPAEWSSVGEAGPDQQTPDISSIIQEIVSRSGWSSGNSLAVIITGTGKRVAESYNGDTSGAPLLHVEYTTGPLDNQSPSVDAGTNQTITLPESSVVLDGTVTDDGLPDPPAEVTVNWSQVSGPVTVVFDNSAVVDTTATFSEAGTYVLQLTADDSELSASDQVTIVVNEEGGETATIYVAKVNGYVKYRQDTWPDENNGLIGDIEDALSVAGEGGTVIISGGSGGLIYADSEIDNLNYRLDIQANNQTIRGARISDDISEKHTGTVILESTTDNVIYNPGKTGVLINHLKISGGSSPPDKYGIFDEGQTNTEDVTIDATGTGMMISSVHTVTHKRLTVMNCVNTEKSAIYINAPGTCNFYYCAVENNQTQEAICVINGTVNLFNCLIAGNSEYAVVTSGTLSPVVNIINSIFSANIASLGSRYVIQHAASGGSINVSTSLLLPNPDRLQTNDRFNKWFLDGVTLSDPDDNIYTVPQFRVARSPAILVLSVDDAMNFEYWKDLADESAMRGFRTTFFLNSGSFDDWSELQTYVDAGHEVASHGRWHSQMNDLNGLEIKYTGSGTACSLDIDSNTLSTTVTGGSGGENLNINLLDSSFIKLKYLADYINDRSGYTASVVNSNNETARSKCLADVSGQDIKTSNYTLMLNSTRFYNEELTQSKADIENNLTGYVCKSFAPPYNKTSEAVQDALKNRDYLGARGTGSSSYLLEDLEVYNMFVHPITMLIDTSYIERETAAFCEWLNYVGGICVLYAHNESSFAISHWQTFLDTVAKSNVTVMTFAEALEHIRNLRTDFLPIGTDADGDGERWTRVIYKQPDYRLQSTSPCIDAGTDLGLTQDFEGNPVPYGGYPDIGIYEYMPTQ